MAGNEDIREIISSAVRDALNSSGTSAVRQPPNQGNTGRENKRTPPVLPSSFLKKKKKKGGQSSLQVWDKDIICFPQGYVKNPQDIPIPRGRKRLQLNGQGLIGKVRLTSDMDEDEIREQICSVFSDKMDNNTKFPFKVGYTDCHLSLNAFIWLSYMFSLQPSHT